MPEIRIGVENKVATNMTPGEVIVCGNSDYEVIFFFDEEWATELQKTARFSYVRDGRARYKDQPFEGSAVAVPVLSNVRQVTVGVYAGTPDDPGDLHTTTPAAILCRLSALCGDSVEEITPAEKASLQSQVEKLGRRVDNIETGATAVRDSARRVVPARVSFMDDDCRREVYHRKAETPDAPSLWEKIQEIGIPYTLACPPGSIYDPDNPVEGNEAYLTVGELLTMYRGGVGVSCHHWRQYNQNEFPTAADYDADLRRCLEKFRAWGIHDVISVSYPQGNIVDDYLPTAKAHFRMGFGVARAINQLPYASFRMDRCEVFPRGDAYRADPTLALREAKARVDDLARDGGWLIFMTHAWYDTFSPSDLQELVRYIREEKGIPITGVNDTIRQTGNVLEVGDISKPLTSMASPFFVVDATGAAHTNALHTYSAPAPDQPAPELELIDVGYQQGFTLSASTGKIVTNSNQNRRVTPAISVQPGEVYRLSCSAVYAGAAFAVTTVEQASTADHLKLAYPVPNTAEGEVLADYEITIPEGGAYLRVSCNTEAQPEGWTIYRVTYPSG